MSVFHSSSFQTFNLEKVYVKLKLYDSISTTGLHLVLSQLSGTDQIGLLEKLKQLDALRKNYYADQRESTRF